MRSITPKKSRRKTYRESLQNNRDAILVSKKLVTIDRNVAVDFDPETMQAQEPDAAAARALFTELEFNTLVQDFLSESIELGETDYQEAKSAAEVKAVMLLASKPGGSGDRAGVFRRQPLRRPRRKKQRELESEQLSLTDAAPPAAAPAATQRVGNLR